MQTAENCPSNEQTESLGRKTVHQVQMPVMYLYLSLVLSPALSSSPAFPHGHAAVEGHWRQFLAERKQEILEEQLFGRRF